MFGGYRCSQVDCHVMCCHDNTWCGGTRFYKKQPTSHTQITSKSHPTSRMKVLLTTLCLIAVSLAALPHLPDLVESNDPDLMKLMNEAESLEELYLERREECEDTTRFPSLCERYCHIGKIAEGVCRKTCGMCDQSCADSYKYGCELAWCQHELIADTRCERTCGTCDQTCQNSYKYGCAEEWCQISRIAQEHCQKTCGTCEEEEEDWDGGCSGDTPSPCPDGSCEASLMDCF